MNAVLSVSSITGNNGSLAEGKQTHEKKERGKERNIRMAIKTPTHPHNLM